MISMRVRNVLKFLLMTARPALLALSFGMILVGSISVGNFGSDILMFAILYSTGICFITFGINDYFDREIDKENQNEGFFEGYVVQEEWQKKSIISGTLLFSLICLTSLPIVGNLARFSVISLLLLAVIYSVPPFRLKSVPLIDSAVNGVGIFLLFALGVGLGEGGFSAINARAYWAGLIFMPMHALASCPDIEGDRKNGVRTAGTTIGWRGSALWLIVVTVMSMFSVDWRMIPVLGHLGSIASGLLLLLKPDQKVFYTVINSGFLMGLPIGLLWLAMQIGII